MSKWKVFVYSLMLVFFAICVTETVLFVLCKASPKINLILSKAYTAASIPNSVLEFRPNPAYIEHDKNGFRNSSVPPKVDIVCIGDSQTYGSGVGVTPQLAWPQQLGRLSGKITYNMAFGGYGPTHYLYLLDEAIAMKPKMVIVGFYAGNDLYDVFNMVYIRNQMGYLKNPDSKVINQIAELEQKQSLLSKIEHRGNNDHSLAKSAISLITDNSKIFGLFRAVGRLTVNNRALGSAAGFLQHPFAKNEAVYDNEKFRTVFEPGQRLLALNMNDVRIQEGLRIALEALRAMNEKSKKNGFSFCILIIPTKELVFKELVYGDEKQVSTDYRSLIDNEESFDSAVKQYLTTNGIQFVEALPALRGCLRGGKQPYSVTEDGHPNAVGYHAIAKLLNDTVLSSPIISVKESR